MRLYMRALRNRTVASHELNRDSSRSHALFTIYVDSMVHAPYPPTSKVGIVPMLSIYLSVLT